MSRSPTPSSAHRRTPTNIRRDQITMDDGGVVDCRYYCLPPFYGASDPDGHRGGGYPFHLVFQGHTVGIFDNWGEAKLSLSGYPNSGNRGFHSVKECHIAWQKMCTWGVHPHPVDPAFLTLPSESASAFVNTTPRRSGARASPAVSVKREDKPQPRPGPSNTQVLADLERSKERYLDLQRRGEEPDLLVTRSFQQASLFALEEAEDDADVGSM
ncbi:hypothetical protein C8R43DRAFT_1131789 [Mycena crocata]|nr:hypothetical protein C8R43DRAFT_1131789 [Mycena crocata]